MNKKKIAITSDQGIDQRLINIVAKLHNIELIIIPKEIIRKSNSDESFEHYKIEHLLQVQRTMQNVDGLILPGNKNDIDPTHYEETNIHPETQKRINRKIYR